jgi:peptidoglycan/xylan/chitin deacetylase (PgdA/CDA1 family)
MREKISRREFLKGAGGIAAHLILGSAGLNSFEITSPLEQEKKLAQIIKRGPSDKPWVSLTIDDCWNLKGVKEILDFCNKYKELPRLTFFPVGQIVEKDPMLWREVVKTGHEIGNHTYGHEHLRVDNLGEKGIIETIKKANEIIFQATRATPHFFRPPGMYGFTKMDDYCNWLRGIIFDCNLSYVALWSVDSYTGAIKPGQDNEEDDSEIIERIISHCSKAKNGDIILMHVNKWDLGAIEQIIASLIERGIKLVTLSELCGIVSFENKQNDLSKKSIREYEEYY